MNRTLLLISQQSILTIVIIVLLFALTVIQRSFNITSTFTRISVYQDSSLLNTTNNNQVYFYRRQSCSCTRSLPNYHSKQLVIDETSSSLCSQYSTLRGFHQRVISISMYGPRDNAMFSSNVSLDLLRELIFDMKTMYPDWILRVYHDVTIQDELICSIECAHQNVDFCNASSLGALGSLSSYIPAKIWRFLPVGDKLVDIMASRDLDSPITQRELDAVTEWLASGKAWHAMRDNPMHFVAMLGGMWGFRPALNRTFASYVLEKILDRSLVVHYGGRGDQKFLWDNVWPHIQDHVLAHDSFLCTEPYGKNSQPWPTRRPHPSNNTNCFVGCTRPCCERSKYPFGECPKACRPQNHTDWTMC